MRPVTNALRYTKGVHKRLMQIRHRCDLYPIPYQQLRMRMHLVEQGHLPEPMLDMERRRHTVSLEVGYCATYTCEEVLPGHPCRHLSVSGPNELPAPEAVTFLMHMLGFQQEITECRVWTSPAVQEVTTDKLVQQRMAVNVLEPLAGDWKEFRRALAEAETAKGEAPLEVEGPLPHAVARPTLH